MRLPLALLMASMLLLEIPGTTQNQQNQVPPGLIEAQKSEQRTHADIPPPLAPRANLASPADLKRDADELLSLAQQVPAEVDDLNHGIHDKDLDAKLRQIEKLSKKLRQQAHR